MRSVDYSLLTEKRCSKCGVTKPISEFGKYNDPKQKINGWRYYSRCIDCARQAAREYGTSDRERRNQRLSKWREANKPAAVANERRKRTKQKYGMTVDEAVSMFAKQNHRCAICGHLADLEIDHDHETGAVRGGLCINCNHALGWLEKDPKYGRNHPLRVEMIAYLRRTGALPADGEPDICHARVLIDLANSQED